MPKVITFTPPPAAIADLAATLQAGGGLLTGTPYYYVVLALVGTVWYGQDTKVSGISNEVSVTPDAVNKTIRLDWTTIAGATGYLVFRTTTSDTYTGNNRFANEINNSTWGYTTTNNYFVDAGAASPGFGVSYMLPVIPTAQIMPEGLSPRTHGIGDLVLDGGTTADPITLQNIYDTAVSGSWTAWCSWDKNNFALMANFRSSANETHFKAATGSVFYSFGYFALNASRVAASDFIFGEIVNNVPTYTTRIYHVSGRGAEVALYDGVKLYGTKFTGMFSTCPYYVESINSAQFLYFTGATADSVTVEGFTYVYNNSIDRFLKKVVHWGTLLYSNCQHYLSQEFTIGQWIDVQNSGSILRMDRASFVGSKNYVLSLSTGATPRNIIVVDPNIPYLKDTYNLPTCRWPTATYYDNYADIYRSVMLKIVKEDGSPAIGASVMLKDVGGTIAADFDGTDINYTTDAQGFIWREKISITSATTTTITDSSKNWTTDQWKGRNLYFISGTQKRSLIKIASNTATQLTLCETLPVAPVADDLAGIRFEVKQARLQHKLGTGAGYGDAFTTKDIKTPHTLIITKTGYQDYQSIITIDRKLDLEVALLPTIFGALSINTKCAKECVIQRR